MNCSGVLSMSAAATYRIQAIMVSVCSSWQMMLPMRHLERHLESALILVAAEPLNTCMMQMTLVLLCTRLVH